ncbi:MAG: acyl-CoA dehydrogenase family protein [Burkholderiaceae bacterium]|nr:acyl-CoA dehydrogenase family protein [Burkholderiaceae bacterium]
MNAANDAARAEQIEMLRNSALDFAAGSIDHKRLREQREKLPGHDTKLYNAMADLGWFGILVPEAYGGLGLGLAEMSVVLQELGKGLLAEPLLATVVLAGQTLRYGSNEALKQELLPKLVDGSLKACVAWQEDAGGLELMPVQTVAASEGGRVTLTGRKRFAGGAGDAGGFIVTARNAVAGAAAGADFAGVYWVPAGAKGLSVTHEWRADGTPSGIITLDSVEVAAGHVLDAPSATALQGLERAVNETCVMAGAETLGVIEATLTMTLEYMRNRVQFGKAIGTFQALQHRAADLYIQQELVRAVLGDAVQTLDSDASAEDCSKIASRCKSRSSEAGLRITREAIQLHGAIGFTDEYDLGLYVKRALVLSAWLGNSTAHRRRFAQLNAAVWQGGAQG